jgi:hypothetical protein
MKKLIALIAVCGFALAFVACGGKKEEAATTEDTTTTVAPVAPDTTVTDTTATDTTAAH